MVSYSSLFLNNFRALHEKNTVNRYDVYKYFNMCRSQWSRGLLPLACWDCGFESRRGAWMIVCWECCVLSDRSLCDGLITCSEESYRLCSVVVYDLETSSMRWSWTPLDRRVIGGGWNFNILFYNTKVIQETSVASVISRLQREVAENCTLLSYYAASSCNLLPTFRDPLSGSILRI